VNYQFEIPALPVLVPMAAGLVLAAWLMLRHHRMVTIRRLITAWALCGYLVAVVAMTLLPLQVQLGSYANRAPWYEKANFIPIQTIDLRTFLLNIILTVPLGLFLPLVTNIRSGKRVVLLALGFSAAIETVQYVTDVLLSSGRTADVNDLLANTLGALLGYLTYRGLERIPRVASFVSPYKLARRGHAYE